MGAVRSTKSETKRSRDAWRLVRWLSGCLRESVSFYLSGSSFSLRNEGVCRHKSPEFFRGLMHQALQKVPDDGDGG